MQRKVYLFLSVMLFSVSIFAQNDNQSWTLVECINRAQSESLNFKQSQLTKLSAEINKKRAYHSRYPSLILNGTYGYNFGRTIDPTSNDFIATNLGFNSWGATINMPLFNGGKIHNSIKQAETNVDAASANADYIKRQIALNVANNYLTILMAQDQIQIAEDQLKLSKQQLVRVNQLIQTGSEAENARLDFEAQLAGNEQAVITAKNNLKTAKLNLLQKLRLNLRLEEFQLVNPEFSEKNWANVEIPAYSVVLPVAMEDDPRIESDSLAMLADRYGIDIARGNYYPSLNINGNLSTNYSTQGRFLSDVIVTKTEIPVVIDGERATLELPREMPVYEDSEYFNQLNNNFGYGFAIGLNIPIYNNYQNKASVEQAKVSYLQSEVQMEQSRWQVKSEVQQAVADARAAQKSYIAQKKTFDAQQAAYENAETRYEIGAINNFDLISAQNSYNQAKRNLISARYELIFNLKVIDYYLGKELRIE